MSTRLDAAGHAQVGRRRSDLEHLHNDWVDDGRAGADRQYVGFTVEHHRGLREADDHTGCAWSFILGCRLRGQWEWLP